MVYLSVNRVKSIFKPFLNNNGKTSRKESARMFIRNLSWFTDSPYKAHMIPHGDSFKSKSKKHIISF